MNPRRISIAAASVAGAGVVAALAVGSGSLAFAESPSPTPSASSTASSPTASASPTTSPNTSRAPRSGTDKTGGASADTPVTGDEAAKVIAAVKAKDSAATITTVRKDPDGSYDALGTKAGAQVMYDVSADLATITQDTHAKR